MGELDIDLGVRLVAARGNIEIVELEPVRLSAEYDMQMTRVAFGAKVAPSGGHERDTGNDGDAVIALLPADGDMRISGVAERVIRKICVRTLRFLEAQDVRLVPGQVTHDEIDAQAHRVDVPRSDGKCHARLTE